MGSKIKKIEIDSFRAYKEKQSFEFIHEKSGNLANLVVIYAPNGYGKTSFFDAIEWAVTGKIDRISGNSAINKEIAIEYGSILKNKNSIKDQGIVKIVDENDDFFEVKTTKISGRIKNDYHPGNYEFISEGIKGLLDEKEQFCTTNLLAHDKITSFLQTYTAGEKFKALEVFWDANKEAKILNIIDNLEKELEKRQKELNDMIKGLDKEIKEYKFEENKQEEIKKSIEKFNSGNGEDTPVINMDIENIDKILDSVLDVQKYLEKNKLDDRNLKTDVEVLISKHEELINENKQLNQYKKEKENVEKQLKIYNIIQTTDDKKQVLDKKIKTYDSILNNWDKYEKLAEQLYDSTQKKKASYDMVSDLKKNEITLQESLRIKEKEIKGYQDIQNNILKTQEDLKNAVEEYRQHLKNLSEKKARKNKFEHLLELRNKKRTIFSSEIVLLEAYLNNRSDFLTIVSLSNEMIIDYERKYQQILLDKNNLDKDILNQEAYYKEKVELQDNINQLLVKGRNLIEENRLCDCPLCHAKYENHEKLFQQVLVDFNSNEELDNIKIKIDENTKKRNELIFQLDGIKERIRSELITVLELKKQNYEYQNMHIRKIEIEISDLASTIQNLEVQIRDIYDNYINKQIDISNDSSVELMYKQYSAQEKNIEKQIQLSYESVEQMNIKIEQVNKQITENSKSIIEFEASTNSIHENAIYINICEFINKHEDIALEKNLPVQKKKITDEKSDMQTQFNNCKQSIEEYEKEVSYPKNIIEEQYDNLLLKIKDISHNYNDYIVRFEKIFNCSDMEIERFLVLLTDKKEILEKQINHVDDKIKKLKEINFEVQNLKEQELWFTKKTTRQDIIDRKELINKKLEQLSNSKKIAQDFIENRIDEYFDSEIINQIYAKIDPHPTMTHIKFQTDLKKNKNAIHIYTYDKSEDEKMSPVLYLSSAQVNILSLCIFLARVLTVKDTTVNTIFMDDPIQHLDGINLLAFIDLLRTITSRMDRQIVISTHNENFYKLMKVKMDDEYYLSRFIDLKCVGEIK